MKDLKSIKKIDIHVHATMEKSGVLRTNGETMATADELVAIYDQLGVEKGVLLPLVSPEAQLEIIGNRETRQIVAKYPDRFYWFCNIDPRQLSNAPDADFSGAIKYYKSLGARGIGEMTSNLYFDDPMVMRLFEFCEEYDLPVTFHIGNMGRDYGLVDELGLPRLEKVLKAFPKLRFLGHSQKFWAEISGDLTEEERGGLPQGKVAEGGRVVELMRKYPNLHGDLSAGSGVNSMVRDPEFACSFMEEFQDRLFYGTDICAPGNIRELRVQLPLYLESWYKQGMISYEICEKILRTNALRFLENQNG